MAPMKDGEACVEQTVSFKSDGFAIAASLRTPDGYRAGDRRPAFVVLHGFGTNRHAINVTKPCDFLSALGYVTLRFDMRGCGDSEGDRGRLICLDQVEDTRNAAAWLAARPEVDPARVALLGSSFGAAISLYAAGIDNRIAAVVSQGGWGNGERKFRGQHATPEKWARFTAMLEEGKAYRARTGKSLMVPRDDIVPIPPALRGNLAPGSASEFPAETAQSMFDFRAEDVVGQIAPRPLLLLHSSNDSVTPTYESIELFRRAGQPTDLHLFAETEHFMFGEGNERVLRVVTDWLAKYFPAKA